MKGATDVFTGFCYNLYRHNCFLGSDFLAAYGRARQVDQLTSMPAVNTWLDLSYLDSATASAK
jgi:hypothetical protein